MFGSWLPAGTLTAAGSRSGDGADVRHTLRFAQLYHDREEITGYSARVE